MAHNRPQLEVTSGVAVENATMNCGLARRDRVRNEKTSEAAEYINVRKYVEVVWKIRGEIETFEI